MAKRYHPKKLIVEGVQDRRVIPELIEKNGIPWGETKDTAIVYIEDYGSDEFIDADIISTELKASGLRALGLIVDADDNFSDRWRSIQNACLKSISDFPEKLPDTGLIHQTQTGIKFGVWVIPDNQNRGMLETFLAYLVPDENETLWQYAQQVAKEAKKCDAPFKEVWFDKAYIYTWLAWQNPPGRQLHQAVIEQILNPQHPKAKLFVNWFKNLYDV
ncbi:MAG: DUF3226 domain-containing protein [Cyanobacteriota bacterium]|nr:DUF3226 domain-containing protein [Cyanobacteriota bacterium]